VREILTKEINTQLRTCFYAPALCCKHWLKQTVFSQKARNIKQSHSFKTKWNLENMVDIYNIRTLSVNIKFICTSFRNRQNSEIFRPVSQRVQMNFIFNDNVRRAMEAVFDPLRLKCANMWHYSIVPSRSEILLMTKSMYKLHSMIFTMHWSRKTILKETFVCSNFPTLGGIFRPPCYIFWVTSHIL
jgi:hypothetical protein